MALTIQNPETERLARELAEKTGASIDDAVAKALRHAVLDQVREAIERDAKREPTRFPNDEESARRIHELVKRIQDEVAAMPVLDDRSPDGLLGYDEWGLPTNGD
jgi:antitoxin VapB